jgi:hypothetical protein
MLEAVPGLTAILIFWAILAAGPCCIAYLDYHFLKKHTQNSNFLLILESVAALTIRGLVIWLTTITIPGGAYYPGSVFLLSTLFAWMLIVVFILANKTFTSTASLTKGEMKEGLQHLLIMIVAGYIAYGWVLVSFGPCGAIGDYGSC